MEMLYCCEFQLQGNEPHQGRKLCLHCPKVCRRYGWCYVSASLDEDLQDSRSLSRNSNNLFLEQTHFSSDGGREEKRQLISSKGLGRYRKPKQLVKSGMYRKHKVSQV